ncbi:SSI family serine proteinase inhibitor [Actinotalea sp. K2]|uniref:SSI family serine proteinase inhibitor n=1 Tax=Actinotalea sp. K2 TaxID=2939438 RepID=UPI002016E2D2|nr:SSI family serine proteinase inhibitor [Actinotalea sp. K2]MCL3859581.1 subtilase-type protease inhibitor [Actinotalea sp. K2]
MRSTVLATAVVVGLLALAGCATGGEAGSPSPDVEVPGAPTPIETDEPTTELVVTVDETGDGQTRTWTLTCDPPGGDHPDPEGACATLGTVDIAEAFAPVPADQMCTQQYGGPQVATVQGLVGGEQVDATFSYTNGCEISRWDNLTALLGEAGTTQ